MQLYFVVLSAFDHVGNMQVSGAVTHCICAHTHTHTVNISSLATWVPPMNPKTNKTIISQPSPLRPATTTACSYENKNPANTALAAARDKPEKSGVRVTGRGRGRGRGRSGRWNCLEMDKKQSNARKQVLCSLCVSGAQRPIARTLKT